MAEYEMQRLRKIEENRKKMKELGIKTLAYEATCLMKDGKAQNRQRINKIKSKKDYANDNEYYNLHEDGEQDEPNEETDIDAMQICRRLSSRSKKVMARGGNLVKRLEKPQSSTSSMASLVKMHCLTHENQEQSGKNKDQQEMHSLQIIQQENVGKQEHLEQAERVSGQEKMLQRKMAVGKMFPLRSQQDKEATKNTSANNGQSKTLLAPGSLGAYLMMKKKSRGPEKISKKIDVFPKEPIQVTNILSSDQPMQNSRKRQVNYSEVQLLDDDSGFEFGLVEENEAFESLDDYASEGEKYADREEIGNDVVEIENESTPTQEKNDQLVPRKEKRTRGPNLCKDVHGWTINDRRPIILNGLGQPIGPDKETLDKFSRFLGSLARDSNLAPLNELNWHRVRDKDNIWDYVKKKFIIAEEGKDYVLRSIGTLWRTHKSRVKKKYYTNYKNVDIGEGPSSIPDSHFKDLLNYWDLQEVQKISEKNKASSESQKNRHTMGPVAFARKRHELQQAERKPPSPALMYRETRKRTPGRKYKTSELDIDQPEYEDHGLLGRCSKRAKVSKSSMLIPDEFLQPYRDEIVKDTISGVLKIFEQHIPSEVLASIKPSFKNPLNVPEIANHLISGKSSKGINDIEQYQDNEDEDGEANDDDDLEGNREILEQRAKP